MVNARFLAPLTAAGLALAAWAFSGVPGRSHAADDAPRTLEWVDLVPPDAREGYTAGPAAPAHDYLGESGPAAPQQVNAPVNRELEGKRVRIPGFIVPLDVAKDGTVSEFFLVPYFGACIHVPPPPANQIVYVTTPRGIALDSIYEAYWITGTLRTQNKSTRLGAAAYSVVAENVEIYKY